MESSSEHIFLDGSQVVLNNTYIGTLEGKVKNYHKEGPKISPSSTTWNVKLNDGSILIETEKNLKPIQIWIDDQNEGGGSIIHHFTHF